MAAALDAPASLAGNEAPSLAGHEADVIGPELYDDMGEDATIEIIGRPGPETEELYILMSRVAERLRREYGVIVTVTVTFTDWSMGPMWMEEGPLVYVNGEPLDVSGGREDIEERVIDMVLALLGSSGESGRAPGCLSLLRPHKDRSFAIAAI